jgi:hypothetical protein
VLFIHPVMQAAGILLALLTFVTGVQRVRSQHLKQKVRFPWKLHVFLGRIALASLLVGAAVGFAMVRSSWGESFMTMGHGLTGIMIVPFLLFGLASGAALDRKKGQHPRLRVAHGVSNALLLLLLLNQARTGLEVYRLFLAGL